MRRRDKTGGKAAKTQRRKTLGRHNAPKAVHRRSSLVAAKETNVARLARERDEAREQQTATADVLRVISRSAFNLQTVLDTLVESAARLCNADSASIHRPQGEAYPCIASYGLSPEFQQYLRDHPIARGRGSVLGRVVSEGKTIHVPDVLADAEHVLVEQRKLGGYRTVLGVPLRREGEAIGLIRLTRNKVQPFTDKQIELVTTFADQAVIAIENTRLLSELRQRTDDLSESLEQQTATSEVLNVISSSPGELQPVFETMLANATRICEATLGTLYLCEGPVFRAVAAHSKEIYADFLRRNPVVDLREHPGIPLDRLANTKQVVHIPDMRTDESYIRKNARMITFVEGVGARTCMAVPMLKEEELVGAILIYRQEVRPFTDKQIELVRNFAAQAVIAIENTRLLSELRESLQQQTATADVLKVISRSTFDLQPVLDTLTESAARLCDAEMAAIAREKDAAFYYATSYGFPADYLEFVKGIAHPVNRGSVIGRTMTEGKAVQISDVLSDPEYAYLESQKKGGFRTMLGVPLLREGNPIGVLLLARSSVRPFTPKQIELVSTFADQAVIAIENVRLFEEVQARTRELSESLEQQMATSEVLRAISSSPGALEPVFHAMLENATRLCAAKFGNLYLCEGDAFRTVAMHNVPPAFAEARTRDPLVRPGPGSTLGRLRDSKRVVHIPDVTAEQGYIERQPMFVTAVELGGFRALLAVPMLKDGNLIGVIIIYRQETGTFSDKQIELVQNFAAQAVIAIENTRLLNELRESLQQQTATADVLKVVSSSPGDLEPVFQAMLENATKLCEASYGTMWLAEGEGFRAAARHGLPVVSNEKWWTGTHFQPRSDVPLARCARTRAAVHVADMRKEPAYLHGDPWMVTAVDAGGLRSLLVVPMLKEQELLGAIAIYRTELRPFSNKQVELVTNFAAQAVIAIENTRLLNELRQRTDDLSEALEQQTATSDVLRVISSSPGELEPVFDAMLANATRICEATFGNLFLCEGPVLRAVAVHGKQSYADSWQRNPMIDLRDNLGVPLDRLANTKQVAHVVDLRMDQSYIAKNARMVNLVDVAGARTYLAVPMLKEGSLIGAIGLYRQEVRPFTNKQIELVQNFAAQAVIAIENTRLLSELRESLQQQTATSEVLSVISSSPGELEPVFKAMLANATDICEAKFGFLWLAEGDGFRAVAMHGVPSALAEERHYEGVIHFSRDVPLGRVALTKQLVHVADIRDEPGYAKGFRPIVRLADTGGARTLVAVPMHKDNDLVGAIIIYRQEVRLFTDKQIALLTNFASQAVIAIENTRLLNELRQSLQQQTATADVLKVISRSTFDLQTVLDTLTASAARLCEADIVNIWRPKGAEFQISASYHASPEHKELLRNLAQKPGRGSCVGRTLLEGKPVHIHDIHSDPEYALTNVVKLGRVHTMLGVPLMREGVPIGVMALIRTEVRPFTDKQIELVTTFADQAVIAIENVRLFESVEARTRELAKSLEDLRTTQDRLVQTQKLASLGQLTAGIAHEIKNPLNFVNNFSAVSVELIDELRQALAKADLDNKLRAEITEIADTLQGNLDKVVQHGKRADAIVKNMLLHSREGSGEHRLVDVNALVEEGLNLAYHGARAEKQGFNITLERSLDPTAGEVDVFPQDITRVLLNLISNGFYAATKRKAQADSDGYEPTLAVATKNLGDSVEIRIRDNGTGIPPEVKERLFTPFFTTKPAGEGTGLGLSISHDIVAKQHGGSIEVDTQPGAFTEFRIILPRTAATIAK
jgi:GAF domain-containing protein